MQMKKLVSVASRTGRDLQRYNLQGCRQVVGCIPYRFRNIDKESLFDQGTITDRMEFLLISSPKSPKWMFPKGGWEIDETMEDAAARETMEEAGVLGVVGNQLGCWTFKSKSQDKCHEGYMLSFMVTEELDTWPEKDVRRRMWVTASEAREKCEYAWMKEALDSFICQVDELQREEELFLAMEERLGAPSLMDFLEDGEPTFGVSSLNGKGEDFSCHPLLLAPLRMQRERFLVPCLMQLLRTNEPVIDIEVECKEEETTLSKLVQSVHIKRKEEECQMPCSFEFLMVEDRMGAKNGGEDVLIS